ncbi:MAG: hypothetical protein ACO4AI_11960 [Prochlorothrix sp.]
MATTQRRINAPQDYEEAQEIVTFAMRSLGENFPIVRDSLGNWDARGCHLLVQALKDCYYYSAGHVLGASLRSLANTAAIIEHRKAAKAKAA